MRRVGNVAAAWRAQPIGQGWRTPTDAIEVGIVFHFIRNRAGGIDTGLPRAYWGGTHAEPWTRQNEQAGNPRTGTATPASFASSAGARTLLPGCWCTARSRSTLSAASTCAPTRWACRTGSWSRLSGASAAPPWRARGRFAASRGGNPDPLRTTVHAGEDFVHLLTGLRLVDQAIEQLVTRGRSDRPRPRPGCRSPRMGAAFIAYRDDARRACSIWYGSGPGTDATVAVIGSGTHERVLDYELAHLADDLTRRSGRVQPRPAVAGPHRRAAAGEHRLPGGSAAAERGSGVEESAKPAALSLSHRPFCVREMPGDSLGGCGRRRRGAGGAAERSAAEGGFARDRRRGQPDLQPHRRGSRRPHGASAWRLRPPRGSVDAPPVSIAIGSDDPLVFASNLRQEYQLLSDALALAGLSDEEARTWLDRTRLCGLEGRFTRPLNEAALEEFPAQGLEPRVGKPEQLARGPATTTILRCRTTGFSPFSTPTSCGRCHSDERRPPPQ